MAVSGETGHKVHSIRRPIPKGEKRSVLLNRQASGIRAANSDWAVREDMAVSADFLIVFDCDGVLVDSERLMQDIDVRMITALGWPITRTEILNEHLGRSEVTVTANIERHLGHPVPDTFVEDRRAAHAAAFRTELSEVSGVSQVVRQLQQAGYASCVASSGTHERIRGVLDTTNLRALFGERIFSSEDVRRGKPAPDLFLHAASSMRYPADRCVVIEDSPSGVSAARAAGMAVIGYCETTPPAALDAADELITRMGDLHETIDRLTRRATTVGQAEFG